MADPNFQNMYAQHQANRNMPGSVNGFPSPSVPQQQFNSVLPPSSTATSNPNTRQVYPTMPNYGKNVYPPSSIQSPTTTTNKYPADIQSQATIKQALNTSSPNLPSLTNQIPHIENKFNNLNVHDYCEAQQPIPSVKSVPNFNATPTPNNNVGLNNNYNNTLKPSVNNQQQPQSQLPPPPTSQTSTAAAFQQGPQNMQQPPLPPTQQQQQPPPMTTQQPSYLPNNYSNQNQARSNPYNSPTMPPYPAKDQQMQNKNFNQVNSQQQYQNQNQSVFQQPTAYPNQNVVNSGFNRMWGMDSVDLMQNRQILPPTKILPPPIKLNHHFHEAVNCSSDIFRCTLNKIPESNSLLQKSRLPLGILIHPYRDLSNLPVISCSTIVRCRVCRTYINPFVFFIDSKKWKCNLCYRVNELPDEFQYDPVSKTYGDPTRRPEIKSSTIEFIAPSEYMLRPPQPAVYLFLLDVSSLAQQSGYLNLVCQIIAEQLENMPGDVRTQIGFIAYNSSVHFYSLSESFNQPHEITVLDVDDIFLPCPDNLLINLKENKELILDLLQQLPNRFATEHDSKSALGSALQAAFKLMSPTGGRVTVFQSCLPNHGPGALQSREDPNNRSSKDVAHLGPATDFYKRLALECSGQQVAVDLFLLNSQYSDLSTLSGICKFSGGCIYHFPLFNVSKQQQVRELKKSLERYLTRKIGFESVMRVRCTRGLSIHTFHGNFFVRSTDLLSLPNINPDSGFGMQISYEESLADVKSVCFQAALLYTSSKGERRIRVHTLCLPVTESLTEVMYSADAQCIVGLLSKMAVDRTLSSNLGDARDAFINATVDIFSAFKIAQNLPQSTSTLVAPQNLSLLPLYISAILKQIAFRIGTSTRLDDRVFAMCQMKSLPLDQLIRCIYPDFYFLDPLFVDSSNNTVVKTEPPRLHLSAEKLDSRSLFLLDIGPHIFIYVGSNVHPSIIKNIFGFNSVNEIPDTCFDLQKLETPSNEVLHEFIDTLNEEKPFTSTIQIIRDTSQWKYLVVEKLVDDRNENSLSYYEFLQHLRSQVK